MISQAILYIILALSAVSGLFILFLYGGATVAAFKDRQWGLLAFFVIVFVAVSLFGGQQPN